MNDVIGPAEWFHEGRKARLAGKPKLDCPYLDPEAVKHWQDGWGHEQETSARIGN